MYFRYQRSYRGPVQAVIFDWAGTTVDFGSLAPVTAKELPLCMLLSTRFQGDSG